MGWMTVIGAGIIAWFMFALAQGVQVGKPQVHYSWVAGIVGFLAAIIAGTAARNTFIYSLVGWAVGLGTWIRVIAFALVLITVLVTLVAILPDNIGRGVSMGLGLAVAWIILPSAIVQGVVPGKAGDVIERAYVAVSAPLVKATAGTFEEAGRRGR